MNINLIKTSKYLKIYRDDTLLSATDNLVHNSVAKNKFKKY